MSRLRADALVAASVPVLLVAGLLPWQLDQMCTISGCGTVRVTAWTGSPAWALPLLASVGLGGLWVLRLPSRPVPTGVAALTAAVATVGAVVVAASLDSVVFGRTGPFHFALPVVEKFPVLSVRPGIGLPLGLLGLLTQAVAGWMTVRARGALVTPWRPPGRGTPARAPAAAPAGHRAGTGSYGRAPVGDEATGFAQGPPPAHRESAPRSGGHRHARHTPAPRSRRHG